MVNISSPRTPDIKATGIHSTFWSYAIGNTVTPLGTPRSESTGEMHQTIDKWSVELEAEMRQVTNQHQVFRAEHNALMVRIRQSVARRATPLQMLQS
eukprot:6036080-Amphidinium_carterae.1